MGRNLDLRVVRNKSEARSGLETRNYEKEFLD
jgi:hypothetical protein